MLNILSIDDDEITQFHLNQILLALGRNRMAYSGEDAIGLVGRSVETGEGYDLIIMDVKMPGLDGLRTVSEMVRLFNEKRVPLEKRPKIVMLSSVDEREVQIDALYACGADHYLTKPVDEDTLRAALLAIGLLKPEEASA